VLDFVQPLAAGGQVVGLCGEARRDEPGREDTLQHVGYIGYGEGDGKRFLSWGRPLRTVLSLDRTTLRPEGSDDSLHRPSRLHHASWRRGG
jgi:hypothetical protein